MPSFLTSDQRAALRADLELRREQLSRQLAEHLHGQTRSDRAAEVAAQDADDAPQRAPEREIAMALTDRERRELGAVTAALQRLESEKFGFCVDCTEAIAIDRLKAESWALRCIACETKFERRAH